MESRNSTYKIHIAKIPRFISYERLLEEINCLIDTQFTLKLSKPKGNSPNCHATLRLNSKISFKKLLELKKIKIFIRPEEFKKWSKELKYQHPDFETFTEFIVGKKFIHYYYELDISRFMTSKEIKKNSRTLKEETLHRRLNHFRS